MVRWEAGGLLAMSPSMQSTALLVGSREKVSSTLNGYPCYQILLILFLELRGP